MVVCWLAVDKNGDEYVYQEKPVREKSLWDTVKVIEGEYNDTDCVELPKGTIKRMLGKELTWEDDCIELREE